MTNIGSLVLILVCVGIGYVLEPIFFSDSKKSPLVDTPALDAPVVESPDGGEKPPADEEPPTPAPVEEDDAILSKITAADFPAKVTLTPPYTLEDAESGATMQLKAGSKVKPLRLEGNQLVFQLGNFPIEGKTNVSNTDFTKLALPLMLKRLQDQVAQNDSSGDGMDSEPEPIPTAKTDVEPKAKLTPEPDPKPDVDPAPKGAGEGAVDQAGIVNLMKASVKAGNVTEFEMKQVVSWKVGGDMEFDGKTYQVGLVTFKAETILGMQEHDAIALIENGAVVKWMWAKTKLEMR